MRSFCSGLARANTRMRSTRSASRSSSRLGRARRRSGHAAVVAGCRARAAIAGGGAGVVAGDHHRADAGRRQAATAAAASARGGSTMPTRPSRRGPPRRSSGGSRHRRQPPVGQSEHPVAVGAQRAARPSLLGERRRRPAPASGRRRSSPRAPLDRRPGRAVRRRCRVVMRRRLGVEGDLGDPRAVARQGRRGPGRACRPGREQRPLGRVAGRGPVRAGLGGWPQRRRRCTAAATRASAARYGSCVGRSPSRHDVPAGCVPAAGDP